MNNNKSTSENVNATKSTTEKINNVDQNHKKTTIPVAEALSKFDDKEDPNVDLGLRDGRVEISS